MDDDKMRRERRYEIYAMILLAGFALFSTGVALLLAASLLD